MGCLTRPLAIAAMGVSLHAGGALADGSLKDDYREPVYRNYWTGFYAGVHLGYQTGQFSGLLPAEPLGGLGNTLFTIIDPIFQGIDPFHTVDPLSIFAPRNANYNGAVAGGQFGYDYQKGPVVIGMFTSASWTDTKFSENAGLSANLSVINAVPVTIATVGVAASGAMSFDKDFEGRLGGRVGLALDRFLVYGLGGVAMAHAKYELNNTLGINVAALVPVVGSATATLSTQASDAHVHLGHFFGLGAEVMIFKGWSLGIEWQRTSYEAVNYKTLTNLNLSASAALNLVATQVNLTVPGQTKIKIGDEDDVRLKLNYRF
jgi:outer membrane immunogenic protein